MTAFEKARVLNPNSARAWEGVALCMYQTKRKDEPLGSVYAAIDPYVRQAVRLGRCPAASLLLAAGAIGEPFATHTYIYHINQMLY